jgi:putative FmdB family regulatory protein
MPMYEFVCRECGTRFEELRPPRLETLGVTCPACSSKKVERLPSSFAAGSGRSGKTEGTGSSCGPSSRGFT